MIGGRYGLSSKEFSPGMIAGVLAELAATATEAALHDRDQRRRVGHEPRLRRLARHRARRHRALGLLRPGLRRHRRRQQEHDQDPRRGGPAGAGLLRLRLEEVRLADDLPSALRARPNPCSVPRLAGELRRLPPVRPTRARRGAGPRRAGGDPAAQHAPSSGARLGHSLAPGAGAAAGQEDTSCT